MSRTFEEVAGGELDALYQGALFLAGGNPHGAEPLLVETVSLAFKEHAVDMEAGVVQRWLEARLVRAFLRNVKDGPQHLPEDTALRVSLDPDTFESLGSDELFSAAAVLPAWPRAALWLVLLRRWSYHDAASAMGVDEGSMDGLLRYRDVLLAEMLSSSRGGRTGLGMA
jgi:DNA-directed RNA polymerase specialized sigma24 family protein